MDSKTTRHPNGQPVGPTPTGRPLEGIADWDIDYSKYTEYALRQRGYIPRPGTGAWLTGYYHFNREGLSYGGGSTDLLDEDGFNEICWTPIGEQDVNRWAETHWRNSFPAIYAWYRSDDMRPYFHRAILFIKSDVYVHTDGGTIDDTFGNSGRASYKYPKEKKK